MIPEPEKSRVLSIAYPRPHFQIVEEYAHTWSPGGAFQLELAYRIQDCRLD